MNSLQFVLLLLACSIALLFSRQAKSKRVSSGTSLPSGSDGWELLKSTPLGSNESPLVVAHRGASCCRPEHSIAAYELALQIGAHYIEQDVVSTADGELVVLHDRDLGSVTDIASKGHSPSKKPKLDKTDPNQEELEEEFFVEDYTLSQLDSLRGKQRFQFRGSGFDEMHPVITLRNLFKFAEASRMEGGATPSFGLYIELKRPTYFRSIDLPLEEKFMDLLVAYNYVLPTGEDSASKFRFKPNPLKPLIIQCFESWTLRYFRERIENIPTILLIKENLETIQPDDPARRYKDYLTDEGLKQVATYASGIGPHKDAILTFVGGGRVQSTGLVKRAHSHKLVVHPYTFRSDAPHYFKTEWGLSKPEEEVLAFLKEGIDGFFSDFPTDGLKAVLAHKKQLSIPWKKRILPWILIISSFGVLFFAMAYFQLRPMQKMK